MNDPRIDQLAFEDDSALAHEIEQFCREAYRSRPAEEWERILGSIDIPAGKVLTIQETVRHPQLATRSLLQDVMSLELGCMLRVLNVGFELEHGSAVVERPPPKKGRDTDEILKELKFDCGQVAILEAEGGIFRQ